VDTVGFGDRTVADVDRVAITGKLLGRVVASCISPPLPPPPPPPPFSSSLSSSILTSICPLAPPSGSLFSSCPSESDTAGSGSGVSVFFLRCWAMV
jgi:hypothetical protein